MMTRKILIGTCDSFLIFLDASSIEFQKNGALKRDFLNPCWQSPKCIKDLFLKMPTDGNVC
jgi:hypothetical protein